MPRPQDVSVDVYAIVDSPGWWNVFPSLVTACSRCGTGLVGYLEPHGHVRFDCEPCGFYVRAFADN